MTHPFKIGAIYKRSDKIAPNLRVQIIMIYDDGKAYGRVISGSDGIIDGFDNMTVNSWDLAE